MTYQHIDWMKAYYGKLKGATVDRVEMVSEDGPYGPEVWPVLLVTLADGTKAQVEVSQDPEGNGPGFLHGLPVPQRAAA